MDVKRLTEIQVTVDHGLPVAAWLRKQNLGASGATQYTDEVDRTLLMLLELRTQERPTAQLAPLKKSLRPMYYYTGGDITAAVALTGLFSALGFLIVCR